MIFPKLGKRIISETREWKMGVRLLSLCEKCGCRVRKAGEIPIIRNCEMMTEGLSRTRILPKSGKNHGKGSILQGKRQMKGSKSTT